MLENSSLKLASSRVKRINQLTKGSKTIRINNLTPFEQGLIEMHKKDIKNLIKDNQLK